MQVTSTQKQSAKTYRENVVGPYREKFPEAVVATMEEQLSGACTVEIAAFDEFTEFPHKSVSIHKSI